MMPLNVQLGAVERGRIVRLRAGHAEPVSGQWSEHRWDAATLAAPVTAASVEKDRNAAWVHIAPLGEWNGHPAGPVTFNAETIGEMVRNFRGQRTPIAFKYEHPDYSVATGPVPSAGKVYALKSRDSGLWALTLFTDRAASHIRAREYEFCSAVINFASTDRRTGEEIGARLLEVGLTDSPFIDGQEPIRLRD